MIFFRLFAVYGVVFWIFELWGESVAQQIDQTKINQKFLSGEASTILLLSYLPSSTLVRCLKLDCLKRFNFNEACNI